MKGTKKKEIVNPKKKRPNRNGKVGIKKHNNYAPRVICKNCGSINHLNYLCKKVVECNNEYACGYVQPLMHNTKKLCDKFDCMLYNVNVMNTCFRLMKFFFLDARVKT